MRSATLAALAKLSPADRKRYEEARDQLGRIASLPDREPLDPLYREHAVALANRIADKS